MASSSHHLPTYSAPPQVDHELVLQVVRQWLPGINLESTTRRTLTQNLADHFRVPFESINTHAAAIRETVHEYCDQHLDLVEPADSSMDGPNTQKMAVPVQNGVDSDSDNEHDSDDDNEDDDSADSDFSYIPSNSRRNRSNNVDDDDYDPDDDYFIEGNLTSGGVKLTSFEKAYVCTPELAEFVGAPVCSRSNVVRAVHQYVRDHGLRHEQDKKIIQADDSLRNVFKVDSFTTMQLGVLLNDVLRKPHSTRDSRFQRALREADEKTLAEKKLKSPTKRAKKRPTSSDEEDAPSEEHRRKSLAAKKQKVDKVGIHADKRLSTALSAVCGADVMSRQDAVRGIWNYIKKKGLKKKGMIYPDEALKRVLGDAEAFTGTHVFKVLDKHLTTIRRKA